MSQSQKIVRVCLFGRDGDDGGGDGVVGIGGDMLLLVDHDVSLLELCCISSIFQ